MMKTKMCLFSICIFFHIVSNVGLIGTKRLRIIHTNDIQSRFDEISAMGRKCIDEVCYGGIARLMTAIKQEKRKARAEGIPLLYVDAGDYFHGSLYYAMFGWGIIADLFKFLRLDAINLGNREFYEGEQYLAAFLSNISIPVVNCNIKFPPGSFLNNSLIKPSIIIKRGGIRIGITGILYPGALTKSYYNKYKTIPEEDALKLETLRLKRKKADIIIALTHVGYYKDLKLASNVRHINVIVGGHSLFHLYTGRNPSSDEVKGPYPTLVNQFNFQFVPVVQTAGLTKYLGVLNLEMNEKFEILEAHGNPILIDSKFKQDHTLKSVLNKYSKQLEVISEEVIGDTKVLLDGQCRFRECNFGNLITDAFVDHVVRKMSPGNSPIATAAILSGGAVRSSIEAGTITRGDLFFAIPFQNTLRVISIEGRYLLDALEWSVARYDLEYCYKARAEFLQMSGIKVEFDLYQMAKYRVSSAKIKCLQCDIPYYSEIVPTQFYNIVTTNYIAKGGDNFTMFRERAQYISLTDSIDSETVYNYIKRKEVVYPEIEGRIKFVSFKCSAPKELHYSSVLLIIIFTHCSIRLMIEKCWIFRQI